jgi:dynamin-binding protein
MESDTSGDDNLFAPFEQENGYEPACRHTSRPPQFPSEASTNNLLLASRDAGYADVSGPALSPSVEGEAESYYRSFRDVADPTAYNNFDTDSLMSMPAITDTLRLPSSSLRSNSNGTTPRHPSIPVARNLKSPYRSVSAPVDEGMAAGGTRSTSAASSTQKQSVRDLARRFDSASSQTTASTHRPFARPAKEATSHGAGYAKTRGAGETPASTLPTRAGILSRDIEIGRTKSSPKTQRAKFAVEDQHSNNTLSSVPRSSRAGVKGVTGNPQASQSLTNLTRPSPPKLSAKIPERKPLFGELAPNASSSSGLGYGIPSRRLSDSNPQPPLSPQHKIQSDAEFSPKSPTSPYDATGDLLRDIEASKSPRGKKHNRTRSDLAANKAGPGKGNNVPGREVAAHHQDTNAVKSPTQSRLPISSKRLSTPSESSSPSSTRSTSPPTSKSRTPHSTRSPKGNVRSRSPTTRSSTETRRSPGQQAHGLANISTASLSAIISASPPKSSPPLRGSRQRLPVSTATASSSRLKAAETSHPSQHSTSRAARSERTSAVPSATTIDYEAHRKQIEISYSKSIKLNEENERHETEGSYLACSEAGDDLSQPKEMEDPVVEPSETNSPIEPSVKTTHDGSLPLAVDPPQLPQGQTLTGPRDNPDTPNMDSPTLGMPGTFPMFSVGEDKNVAQPPPPDATGFVESDRGSRADSPRHGGSRPLILPHNIVTSTADIPRQYDDSPLDLNSGSGSIRIVLDTLSIGGPQEALPFDRGDGQPSYDDVVLSHSYGGPPATVHLVPQQSNEVSECAGDSSTVAISITAENLYFEEPQSFSSSDEMRTSSAPFGLERAQNWESESPTQDQPLNLPDFEHRDLDLSFSAEGHLNQENSASPVTEMEYESSEGGVEGLHGLPGHYDTPQSARLSIPYPYRLSNRLSRHSESEWTDDISCNTTEPGPRSSDRFSYIDRPAPPPKEEHGPARPDVPPKSSGYSPMPPPGPIGGARMSSPSRSLHNERSPSVDNLGSSGGLKSPSKSHTVPAPLKSPPPVPQSRSETTYLQPSQAKRISLWDSTEPPKGILSWDSQARRESGGSQTQFDDELVSEEPPKPVVLTEEELVKLKKRSHIIKELIDTEAVYLKDMNVVEEIYKGTAEACPNLEPGDVKTIFRNSGQVVGFSTMFLDELKAAAACVYTPPRAQKSRSSAIPSSFGDSAFNTLQQETGYERDQKTYIGANFLRHLKEMKIVYTEFLKSHELAMNRLMVLQSTPTVKVWLDECNLVAKDLTSAWDLDALLIKPVQRITRYQLFLTELRGKTPEEHPDYSSICAAREGVQGLLQSIDSLKKRLDTVSKIVNGYPKANARSGLVTAFVRRRDKTLATNTNRPKDDPDFVRAHDRFSTDYLRLQIVLRDVEFYTRQIKEYAGGFLMYLSAIEVFMRVHVSPYPELESKWTRFNVSMRDLGTVVLESHVSTSPQPSLCY